MSRTVQIVVGLLILAGIVGVVVAATHNNNDSSNSSSTTTPQSKSSNDSSQSNNDSTASTSSSISIMNMAFSPASTTVKRGTQVTWTNNDSTAHTVTSDSEKGPNSDTLQPGGKYSFTFNDEGTIKYHCSIHPFMTGSVTVTE